MNCQKVAKDVKYHQRHGERVQVKMTIENNVTEMLLNVYIWRQGLYIFTYINRYSLNVE